MAPSIECQSDERAPTQNGASSQASKKAWIPPQLEVQSARHTTLAAPVGDNEGIGTAGKFAS